jgi:hypothetical protein
MNRLLRAIGMVAVTLSATVAFGIEPAQASLGSCSPQLEEQRYDVYCNGSRPTAFRAWVVCTNFYSYYGFWRFAGDGVHSVAKCPTNYFVYDYGYNVSAP